MKEYNNLKELKKDIYLGVIDEKDLQIILDNDMTSFLIKDGTEEINIKSAEGYQDILELYRLLFPLADVDWC